MRMSLLFRSLVVLAGMALSFSVVAEVEAEAIATVSEPGSFALLALGCLGLMLARKKK